MGIHSSAVYAKKKKILSVISLNYSGILLSPFQFFSNQNAQMTHIETNLSNIYKSLLKKDYKDFNVDKKINKFKWSIGKIDQKMQKQRYSPLYNKEAGIQNNQLINKIKFKQRWNFVFNQNIQAFKQKEPQFKCTLQEKSQACDFDLYCYKSILVHVYKQLFNFQFDKVPTLNVNLYRQFMNKMFDKSFLNEQKKLAKTLAAMRNQKIDIVFAQQADENLINKIETQKQFKVVRQKSGNSIIILKTSKFHNYYSLQGNHPLDYLPQLKQELNWNNDTVVTFVDNLILISGHLSSKKQKNQDQVYKMMQSLKKLHALFPMCHILVGCDANSFVPNTYAQYCKNHQIFCQCKKVNLGYVKPNEEYKDLKNHKKSELDIKVLSMENLELKEHKLVTDCLCFKPVNCEIFPDNQGVFTTSKKRTYLQPQVNKAEQQTKVCRDHLIIFKGSDISIQKKKVCTILDKNSQKIQSLPCQEHPYDHYVVKGQFLVNVMTHFKDQSDGQ